MLSNTLKLQHLYSAQRIIFMKSKTLVKALIFLIAANIICISSFFVIINVMKNDENGSYSERDSEKDTNDDKYLNVIAFEPAEATEKISGYTDGNNVIAIMLDEEMISCPTVNSRIDTDECYIQGGFDKDSAEKLAAMISCGQLPFSLKETSQ